MVPNRLMSVLAGAGAILSEQSRKGLIRILPARFDNSALAISLGVLAFTLPIARGEKPLLPDQKRALVKFVNAVETLQRTDAPDSFVRERIAARFRATKDSVRGKSNVEFFTRRIRPVLEGRCLGCHGGGKRKGGLSLENRTAARAGGACTVEHWAARAVAVAPVPAPPSPTLGAQVLTGTDPARSPKTARIARASTASMWGMPEPRGSTASMSSGVHSAESSARLIAHSTLMSSSS